jgi:putative endonuclease
MIKQPCVYILSSRRKGTLYVGVTSDLIRRVWEHKNGLVEGFTKRYGVHDLVWYEVHETMESAIGREKARKEWKRNWKLEMIEKGNPDWKDIYNELAGFRLSRLCHNVFLTSYRCKPVSRNLNFKALSGPRLPPG